jgi:hypothetical protein
MKHRQNQGRILLPQKDFKLHNGTANLAATYTYNTTILKILGTFQLSTTQTIELWIDTELQDEIPERSNENETIRGIREKLKNSVRRDNKIA